MSIPDGFILYKDGKYHASYYGKELGCFDLQVDAMKAVLASTEGRPTRLVSTVGPSYVWEYTKDLAAAIAVWPDLSSGHEPVRLGGTPPDRARCTDLDLSEPLTGYPDDFEVVDGLTFGEIDAPFVRTRVEDKPVSAGGPPRPLDTLDEAAARSRWRGALLGLAVGDALGTTLEFTAPGTFEPLTEIVGGGPFGLLPGQWTDDTSMALCLAESLLECRGFDPVDQLERYVRWYRDGHWSSTGECFDIGGATRAALERFEARPTLAYPGDDAPHAGGNGPLMKLAPVVMAFAGEGRLAIENAERSARTTHGNRAAVSATGYFAALLLGALRGEPKDVLLEADEPFDPIGGLWSDAHPLHPEVLAVAQGSFRERQPPDISGGGYAVHALEAALWAVRRGEDFEQAVLAAANLGDDADTTAAIAGQLAGAIHGVDAIPIRWRALVHRGDEIIEMADALYGLAAERFPHE